MNTYTSQIDGLVNWVMTRVSKYLGIESCKVRLTPFKLTDDDSLRQMLLQMHMQGVGSEGGSTTAASTLYEAFGMDYAEELKKAEKDAILKANSDVNIKFAVEQATFIAAKEVTDKFDKNSDYRNMLAKAHELAQQLYQSGDEATQRQVLGELRITEYPLYIMTLTLMKEFAEQTQAQAETQAAVNSAAPEEGGGPPTSVKPKKDASEQKQEPGKKNSNTEGK